MQWVIENKLTGNLYGPFPTQEAALEAAEELRKEWEQTAARRGELIPSMKVRRLWRREGHA